MSFATDFIKRMTHGRIVANEHILRKGDAIQLALHMQDFMLGTSMLRFLCKLLPTLNEDERERLVASVASSDRLIFRTSEKNQVDLYLEYIRREPNTIPVIVYGYYKTESGIRPRDLPYGYSCTAPIIELYTEGCDRRWVMVALLYNNLTGEEVLRSVVGASHFDSRGYDALWQTAKASIEDWCMVKQDRHSRGLA